MGYSTVQRYVKKRLILGQTLKISYFFKGALMIYKGIIMESFKIESLNFLTKRFLKIMVGCTGAALTKSEKLVVSSSHNSHNKAPYNGHNSHNRHNNHNKAPYNRH